MYICICKGVTESQISEAIAQGSCTRKALATCLKAGTGCGKCGAEIRQLLHQSGAREHAPANTLRHEAVEHKQNVSRRRHSLNHKDITDRRPTPVAASGS